MMGIPPTLPDMKLKKGKGMIYRIHKAPKRKVREIIVTGSPDNFKAHVSGQPKIWEAGKTREEAINNLIRSRGKTLGLKITTPPLSNAELNSGWKQGSANTDSMR